MSAVLANAAIPTLFPQMTVMGIALVPVVLIESAIVWKPMAIRFRKALVDVGLANFVTTIVGIPLFWVLTFALGLVATSGGTTDRDSPIRMLGSIALGLTWIPDYLPLSGVPALTTALLLFVPCFLISLLVEWWVLIHCWTDKRHRAVFLAVLRANVWSCLFLFVAGSLWTISNLQTS
ncbi:MAG TPA: hypothetical protein GYA07_15285 [Verrucomicrobia bacterium]|nr:hypothetical protein [Verrucomicrobiota bacterium]HOP96558.1 hypothetical protein [Verrucomicrobiota bacterium]HPU55537.1 hypothetical protein [Verrucomicrobiota bacterium]